MSEISKINLGLPKTNLKTDVEKPQQQEVKEAKPEAINAQNVDAKTMMSAMDAQGRANAVHFGFNGMVDPAKYLSSERINDIEASMVTFGNGVAKHTEALNEEFGHLDEYSSLKDADKLAMAAQSFAQSE